MKIRTALYSDWTPVILAGIAMPAVIVAGFMIVGKTEVAGIIAILGSIFLGMVTLGTIVVHRVAEQSAEATNELAQEIIADIESIPGLEWIDMVPMELSSPVTLKVTDVVGLCTHGFLPGNTWTIDSRGNLSRPLCAAAANALKAGYRVSTSEELPNETACDCPLANRKVKFELLHKN